MSFVFYMKKNDMVGISKAYSHNKLFCVVHISGDYSHPMQDSVTASCMVVRFLSSLINNLLFWL